MGLWAIVPVKPLRRGKSRLAGVLSEESRYQLNHKMLMDTLKTLSEVEQIEHTLVVSRDTDALSLARDYGAKTVQEEGRPELNIALTRATAVIKAYGAHAILVVPADLPLVTSADICEMINCAGHPPEMVIAPDRREDGTNALYIDPAGAIEYQYGINSFQCHVDQARQKGLRVEIFRQFHIALDLDLPEDLKIFERMDSVYINGIIK